MSEPPEQAARFLVSGRVQGVGYRASALSCARELGLSGWVRNLRDGRVETLASGSPEQMEAYTRWLNRGPALARVDRMERLPAEPPREPGFRLLPTPSDYP